MAQVGSLAHEPIASEDQIVALLSIEKAEAALRLHRGVILRAAEACGVARNTFYRFMQQHPQLHDVRDECDEELLDIAEDHVITSLQIGDMKTVRWHLERKGKDRGYTTRSETTGKDGEPLGITAIERRIVTPKSDD